MSNLRRIVVVGASLAGLRGAEELRRSGYDGELTLIGREDHFPPYDRPPLSKEVLSGKWSPDEARLKEFQELDATLLLGAPATGLDLARRSVTVGGGRDVGFDGLMIATGTTVRRLRCPGSDLAGVLHFRDVEDCLALRDMLPRSPRVVLIGAGFIGSEIAAVCRGLGLETTLVDMAELPLSRQVGPMVAKHLMRRHREHGVSLRLGVGLSAIEGDTHVEGVVLTDGTRVPTDVVIAGIGVAPASDWLQGSGLLLDGGVVCDEYCRAVGTEDVVAAGDIACWTNPRYGRTGRVEHWTNAVEQAEYAAQALLGKVESAYSVAPYFWSDQYGMHLQSAGVIGDEQELVEGSLDEDRFVVECRAEGRATGVIAVNWVARFQRRRRALNAAADAADPVS